MDFLRALTFATFASLSISASAAPVALPDHRVFVGKTATGDWVVSTVPGMMGDAVGISYDYPESESELDQLVSQERAAGALVYDLRGSAQALPIPEDPYHSDGYHPRKVVAVTEFSSIPGSAEFPDFLLFLTAGAVVTEYSDHFALTHGRTSRFYRGPTAAAIKAARPKLIECFEIDWQIADEGQATGSPKNRE